jgi:sugar/nucleoside kinase (ribokinase family)
MTDDSRDSALDIVALGEPMIEFNQEDPANPSMYRRGFGGDTSNFAVAAARDGARIGCITRIGRDAFGEALVALWHEEGVDSMGVTTRAPESTSSRIRPRVTRLRICEQVPRPAACGLPTYRRG